MRILPRHRTIHPTLQPIHAATTAHRKVVNVRVPSTAAAVAQYREGAEFLRSVGLEIAATLLESTADSIAPEQTLTDIAVARTDTDTMVQEMS